MENIDSIIKQCVFIRTENHVCTMKVLQPIHNTHYINLSPHFTATAQWSCIAWRHAWYKAYMLSVQNLSYKKVMWYHVWALSYIHWLIICLNLISSHCVRRNVLLLPVFPSSPQPDILCIRNSQFKYLGFLLIFICNIDQWHFYLLSRSPIFQLVNLVSDI